METNTPINAPENNPSQLQQLRSNVKNQIELLKEHIRNIQQDSLKSMHDIINKTFRTLVTDNLEQLSQQEKSAQQQLSQDYESTGGPQVSATGQTPIQSLQLPAEDDAGKNALEIARQNAEQAMKHASEMVQNATKNLDSLPPQK